MSFRCLSFLLVLILVSCLDHKDYELDSLTITPTMALPLATGDISMMDLVSNKDSAYLKVYPDGLLYFSYPTVFPSRELHNLFVIPTKNSLATYTMPAGTLPASPNNTTLGTITPLIDFALSPQKLSEILLKSGSLNYSISLTNATTPALPLDINMIMTDVVAKGNQVPLTFTAGIGSGSKSLKDYIIKMNANTFSIRIDVVVKPHASTSIPPGTKLNVQLSFEDMDFRYIKGFLGDRNVNLPQQTIPITAFSASLKKSKVTIVAPKITLSIDDYYGVPCEVTFSKLQAEKTGASLPLQITPVSPFGLNVPAVIGNSATTSLIVNNAVPIINFAPTQLVYAGSVRINKGLTSGPPDANFLTDSTLRVSLNTEVPLYGQASGISLTDTMKINLDNSSQSSFTTSSLKVKSVNEMPLDASIQLYFADKTYKILDSVFTTSQTYIVRASEVTAGGDLQKAGSSDLLFELPPDKLTALFSSGYLIIRSKMNTTKDANGALLNVKFKSSYKLKISVGLLAKMKITSK